MARVDKIWSTAVAGKAAKELILDQILLFYGKSYSLWCSKSNIKEHAEGDLWPNNLRMTVGKGGWTNVFNVSKNDVMQFKRRQKVPKPVKKQRAQQKVVALAFVFSSNVVILCSV